MPTLQRCCEDEVNRYKSRARRGAIKAVATAGPNTVAHTAGAVTGTAPSRGTRVTYQQHGLHSPRARALRAWRVALAAAEATAARPDPLGRYAFAAAGLALPVHAHGPQPPEDTRPRGVLWAAEGHRWTEPGPECAEDCGTSKHRLSARLPSSHCQAESRWRSAMPKATSCQQPAQK